MKYTETNPPLKCLAKASLAYINNSTITIKGVLWHSTGANNPKISRYVYPKTSTHTTEEYNELKEIIGLPEYDNGWNRKWEPSSKSVCPHAAVGKLKDGTVSSVQCLPWNYRPHGCGKGSTGSSCNNGWIQFEICEDDLSSTDYFNQVFEEGCQLTAFLCNMFDLDPDGTATCGSVSNVPVILSHGDAAELGLASQHIDPRHWFNRYGKTMADVRKRVKEILQDSNGVYTAPVSSTSTSSSKDGTSVVYKTYSVGVNLVKEEFVLPNELNKFASTMTPELEKSNNIFNDLFPDTGDEGLASYVVSKTVPLINKTSMELDSSGLRFYTESMSPSENFNYLNNLENETSWNSLNNTQTTSLNFDEIISLKSGNYNNILTNYSNSAIQQQSSNENASNTNNYLTFGMKYLYVSQRWDGGYSHRPYSYGSPPDYPIDIQGKDGGRDWFYCPCNEIEVIRISYSSAYGNGIFLQSTSQVLFANGIYDYVSMLLFHPETVDVKRLHVGQKFTRGQQICQEGMTGRATGNHFHLHVASGKFNSSKCVKYNSNSKMVLAVTGKNLKPEEAFYIDPSFTTIRATGGLNFKNLPTSLK